MCLINYRNVRFPDRQVTDWTVGDPLAAGGDDRFDELAVGVFVAAIDELGEA